MTSESIMTDVMYENNQGVWARVESVDDGLVSIELFEDSDDDQSIRHTMPVDEFVSDFSILLNLDDNEGGDVYDDFEDSIFTEDYDPGNDFSSDIYYSDRSLDEFLGEG